MKRYYFVVLFIIIFSRQGIAQIGIFTEDPNPLKIDQAYLDVNGRTIIRNTDNYNSEESRIRPIGVDKNGVLLKIGNIPSDVAFYQSINTDTYSDVDIQSFNSAKEIPVSWNKSTDLVFDDLMDFDETENSFAFTEDGMFEIGGFINFGILMPSSYTNVLSNYMGINATIQYLAKDNESAGWKDLSTCRKVYTGGALSKTDYRYVTLRIPSVLYPFSKGDKLRFIVKKPIGMSVASIQISKPIGSVYSKSLRVLVP